jgi:23S rRNA (pseudouridine1915-N3)-methyltransferase
MRIKICWMGKTQNVPIRSLTSDYLERLRHWMPVEIVEIPDPAKRRNIHGACLLAAEREAIERVLAPETRRVVLDERGAQFRSPEFAHWLETAQVQSVREITFIVGGPEGIDAALAGQAHLKLSLGRMTWTHEMARMLLLEQIYRALCILRNVPYHK